MIELDLSSVLVKCFFVFVLFVVFSNILWFSMAHF